MRGAFESSFASSSPLFHFDLLLFHNFITDHYHLPQIHFNNIEKFQIANLVNKIKRFSHRASQMDEYNEDSLRMFADKLFTCIEITWTAGIPSCFVGVISIHRHYNSYRFCLAKFFINAIEKFFIFRFCSKEFYR